MKRIAVFRALMLGDLLCAVPALRALRAGFAQAHITLIGLPWARELAARLPCIDDFEPFPGHPSLPESSGTGEALRGFYARLQARRFDLALQMHGNGGVTNRIVVQFGARHTAAFCMPSADVPDPALAVPWPERGHEIERCLALTDHLGLPRQGLHLELPLHDEDRAHARQLTPAAPYAVVHPGSQLPSRRWPLSRFAQVTDALADAGLEIVITASAGEAALARELQAAMKHPARNLAGCTSLWTLGAVVEQARVVVCNDTGISHVAAAVHTPSVVVACGSDVSRWAPLNSALHRVLWQDMPCRPCGHAHCPTAHECAQAVTPEAVIDAVMHQLHSTPPWPSPCASSPGTSTAITCTT